ncbi:hypothetical protein TWF696_000288 [Orbilia brochopaga]|uniref:Uncharacterized protein n=1 Tax=Orbilia brochopaga TaxID=3140254 RepID=A0AAV9VEF4_9PEZI
MQFIWFTREPDLIVEIEDDQKKQTYLFLVACVPLRLASPVWDRILKPRNGFRPLPETVINGMPMRVLKLYDDDVSALGWIFNIIHFQTDQVPRELSFDNMLAVTVLCDKYNLQSAVTPWAEGWINHLLPDTTELWWEAGNIFKQGVEDWLFIGNTFSKVKGSAHFCPKVLSELVEEIVGEMENTEIGTREPRNMGGTIKVNFDLVPESLFHHIKTTRKIIFDDSLPKLKQALAAIHDMEEDLKFIPPDTRIKTCQGGVGCYDVSLVSSIGAASHGDYEIETLYCESCIKREVPVWKLQKRIDTLQEIERTHSLSLASRTTSRRERRTSDHPRLRDRLPLLNLRT